MAEILVTEQGGAYAITLTDGASVTQHEMRVPPEDLVAMGIGDCDPRLVVEESLRFLLEREPKESILESFDLSTITGFFPEFPEEIRRRMRGDLD